MAFTLSEIQTRNNTETVRFIKAKARMSTHDERLAAFQKNLRENLRKQVQTGYTANFDLSAYFGPRAAVSTHGTERRIFFFDLEHKQNAVVSVSVKVTVNGSDVTVSASNIDPALSHTAFTSAVQSGLSTNSGFTITSILSNNALSVQPTSGNTITAVEVTVTDGTSSKTSLAVQFPLDLSGAPA